MNELEQAQAKIAELEATIATNATAHAAELATKDAIIDQKTKDVVGARRKYKLLGEMSDEEKANLTPEEIAAKEAQDEIVIQQETMQKEQAEQRTKEVAERKLNIAKRMAPNDPDAQAKIVANFDKIKGSELATVESEIEPFMNTALNMLGDDKPQPVQQVMNAGGGQPPAGATPEGTFADSEAGKSLATSLGLTSAKEGDGGAK